MEEGPVERLSFSSNMGLKRRSSSLGRTSSRDSSRRNSASFNQALDSISLTRALSDKILGAIDSSLIAQAGDSGDRVVVNDSESVRSSGARVDGDGVSIVADDALEISKVLQSIGGAVPLSPVLPLAEEIASPLPSDAILQSSEASHMVNEEGKDKHGTLPKSLDYISYMIHLAVFGEFGVFTRYLLQKLFGPDLLSLIDDDTPLYLDLPANMLGSFLMGWFGVVFKSDIRNILSDQIVVGLTTGYLGSLTTFSGWNQKMVSLSSGGHWVFAVAGIILGILLVNESIRLGVESAEALRRSLVEKFNQEPGRTQPRLECWRVDNYQRHLIVMISLLLILLAILGLSGALVTTELDRVRNGAVLWLGCLVGPLGVWGRWYLARLNGQGIGRKEFLKWLPMGTLLANVLAACLMAALATISKVVNTKRCGIIVSGVQFGFLGCLSTVSTFVAEVYAMRQSGHSGRALAYVALTVITSFALGTLVYSVPVWAKHYK